MAEEFEKVVRYKCKWCGGIFSTERHKCKFSPKRKNCMSCKHCIGFRKGSGAIYDPVSLGYVDVDPSWFICDMGIDGYNDLTDIHDNGWDGLGCDSYELMDNYNGKKSYSDALYLNQEKVKAMEADEEKRWVWG